MIECHEHDNMINQWLERLGYSPRLFSKRARSFVMTFHSKEEVAVSVRDSVNTDLDVRANLLIMDKFGQEMKVTSTYRILYTFSEQVLAFSYAVQNLLNKPIDVHIDFSKSESMLLGNTKSKEVNKVVPEFKTEFIMHTMAQAN